MRDNLILWGSKTFYDQNIANLEDLSGIINNEDFSSQLRKLNQNLYAGASEKIDEGIIMSVIKDCKNHKSVQAENEPLPKLYK